MEKTSQRRKRLEEMPRETQENVKDFFTKNPNVGVYETVDPATRKKILYTKNPDGTIEVFDSREAWKIKKSSLREIRAKRRLKKGLRNIQRKGVYDYTKLSDEELKQSEQKLKKELDTRKKLKEIKLKPTEEDKLREIKLKPITGNLDPKIDRELVALLCPECAEEMKKLGIKRIGMKALFGDKWTTKPYGWTQKSLESFWKSIGGSVTKCIEKAKKFTDDPAAFCASLKDRVRGTTYWRGPKSKKKGSMNETNISKVRNILAINLKGQKEKYISWDYDSVLKELVNTFGKEYEDELRKSLKLDEGRYSNYGHAGSFTYNGEEYNLISSEEEAERIAFDLVVNDLEENLDLFNKDWVLGWVDEDKYLNDIRSDIEEMVEESPESYTAFIDDEEPAEGDEYSEEQKERMVEEYLEDIRNQGVVNWLEGLGYSGKDLSDHLSSYLPIRDMAEDAIRLDGWAYFLSLYDGNYETTPNGLVYFRE